MNWFKQKKAKYFAYGSNMSANRIRSRTPSAAVFGVFILQKHQLKFHKIGQDGSAKCNALFTGAATDAVEGVVYEISIDEIEKLDRAEGLGNGYEKIWLEVVNTSGEKVHVFAYIATSINNTLQPFSWYRKHVLEGARCAGLSTEYISAIENVRAMSDPDAAREKMELLIYD